MIGPKPTDTRADDMTDASRKDAAAALGMDLANDLQNRFKPRKEMWHWCGAATEADV